MTTPETDFSPAIVSPSSALAEIQPEKPLKLGVLASGKGSNFEAIARAIENGQLNARVQALLYNKPDAQAAELARSRGIPAIFRDHRGYSRREDYDRLLVETLREREVEWVAMAGWMRVVTPAFIEAFPERAINIHPSLLPSFKGTRAIEEALAAGVTLAGCTAHLVSAEVDSGPILIQAAVPVLPDDTPETLHQRVQVQEHAIMPRAIALAARRLETRVSG